MQRALDAIPRLGQRVIGAPLRIVPPEFADDPTLDLDAHVQRRRGAVARRRPRTARPVRRARRAAARPGATAVGVHASSTASPDGRAALLQKVHHTITDGVGGLKLSLAMVDFERDPDSEAADEPPDRPSVARPHRSRPPATRWSTPRSAASTSCGARSRPPGTSSTHPSEVPGRAVDAARLLTLDPTPGARHRRRPLRRHDRPLAAPPLRDPRDSRSSRCALPRPSSAGSVNDVFVTGLASALGRYHERAGQPRRRAALAMPISTRQRGDTVDEPLRAARACSCRSNPRTTCDTLFGDVHERLQAAKRETALQAAEGLAGVIAGPAHVAARRDDADRRPAPSTSRASNLRGSPVPLYLAGARILGELPDGTAHRVRAHGHDAVVLRRRARRA